MLDFKALKAIPLTQVLQKYGIALTFAGKYAKARCPLPTHKQNDRDKNFNINLEGKTSGSAGPAPATKKRAPRAATPSISWL